MQLTRRASINLSPPPRVFTGQMSQGQGSGGESKGSTSLPHGNKIGNLRESKLKERQCVFRGKCL